MPFTSSDEVVTYIGGIFEAAFADADLAPRLKATGVVLRFAFTDPDTDLVVDFGEGTVGAAAPGAEIGATMTMSADTGNGYWQGKVNLPLAMAKGAIRVDGKVAPLLKLAPLSKKLYPVYIDRLTADGRTDLLV